MPKWPSGALGTRPRCPTHSARPPRLTGDPQLAPRPGQSEVLAGYLPAKTARRPPTPTTRAPSVLGMCGWVSAPRTALPRVYRRLVCSLGVSAPPRRVVRRTTMPRVSPQSLSTHPTCTPRGRGSTTRPLPSTHGPEESTPSDSALVQAIPASLHAPSRRDAPPRARHHPSHPRHDDAREVHAGWSFRGDHPRSQGHRLGVGFASPHSRVKYTVYPPSQTYQQHALAGGGSGLWGSSCPPSACGRRSGRVPVAYGLHGRGGSRRSLGGTSRLVTPCHEWRRSSRHMRSLSSSCAPLGEGLHHTRGPNTAQYDRLAPLGRRVALRADRRW